MRIDDRDAAKAVGTSESSSSVNGTDTQKPRQTLPCLDFSNDEISLSGSSSLVKLAMSASADPNAQRAAEIKAAIESNTYHPDLEEVSKALMVALAYGG